MINAFAALMLIVMMPGQAVVTETTPIQAPAAVVQTISDSFDSLSADTAVGPTVPETPAAESVQTVLLSVCESRGYGEDCARTLLGMLWIESNNISTAVGDSGLARGYFQIHYKMHKITTACAEDLVCSANWSLTYMESHSYPRLVSYAVQCHNSCNVGNGYAAKALRNGKRLWDTPLAIAQSAPIVLAMN